MAMPLIATAAATSPLLDAARQQLAAGNAAQAYKILEGAQRQFAQGLEYDYLLGVAALESGKYAEAIIAFERVLAEEPKHAGALLDLGRAYFEAGSLDLAETTFLQLRKSQPPAPALAAIGRYLLAIAQRRAPARRSIRGYGEMSVGYDSNITGVPADFPAAVLSAFNISGVDPTGNSIKRKAAFLGAAAGVDYEQALRGGWSAMVGAEARGRAYHRESKFDSVLGDARAGVAWSSGAHGVRFSAGYSQFSQEGDATGEPKPNGDRKTTTAGGEYRYAISVQQQLNLGLSAIRVRFPRNDIEDFNAVAVSAGWTRSFTGNGAPVLQISGYVSRDEAVNKLADELSDKSKRIAGLRATYQHSLSEKLSAFGGIGFTTRRDKSAFARATEVEFGRDRLTDVTLGVNWRFRKACGVRAQWLGSRNDSNIAIYDYRRNEVSSNIRCDFM